MDTGVVHLRKYLEYGKFPCLLGKDFHSQTSNTCKSVIKIHIKWFHLFASKYCSPSQMSVSSSKHWCHSVGKGKLKAGFFHHYIYYLGKIIMGFLPKGRLLNINSKINNSFLRKKYACVLNYMRKTICFIVNYEKIIKIIYWVVIELHKLWRDCCLNF